MADSKDNIEVIANLQKQGLSFSGAKQVLSAQVVTSQKDRGLLAQMMAAGHSATSDPVRRYNLENAWPSK